MREVGLYVSYTSRMNESGGTPQRKDDRLRKPISGVGALFFAGLLLLGVFGLVYTNRLNHEVAERYGGLFVCAFWPLAGIMGVVALSRKDWRSKGMGCLALLGLLYVLSWLPALAVMLGKHEVDHAACAYRLSVLHRVCGGYAAEHDGAWPPLTEMPGDLAFPLTADTRPLDRMLLQCPVQIPPPGLLQLFNRHYEDAFPDGDTYYWYLGHLVTNEAEGLAFVEGYRHRAEHGLSLASDYESTPEGAPPVYRLSNQLIDRLYGPRPTGKEQQQWPPSRIPVIVERPHHKWRHKTGGTVLFLDGHVQWLPYPGEFPMTEAFIHALESLDALEKGKAP